MSGGRDQAADISIRIDMLRLILILGIVFIHVPFDDRTAPYNAGTTGFDWVMIGLRDGLFRVGVPCLSLISGYLIGLRPPSSYRALLNKKAKSIALPFLFFNLSTFALVLVLQLLGYGSFWPDMLHASTIEVLDALFSIADQPINIPLYFMRDLMMCILLYPLLAWIVARAPGLFLGVILIVLLLDIEIWVILRIRILFCFVLGMTLAMHKVNIRRFDHLAGPALALLTAIIMALTAAHVMGNEYLRGWAQSAEKIGILISSVLVWIAAAPLGRTGAGQAISERSYYSFFIFCTHQPLLVLCSIVQSRLHLPYPLFFFSSALVAIVAAVALFDLMARFAPGFLSSVTGVRVRPKRAPLPDVTAT